MRFTLFSPVLLLLACAGTQSPVAPPQAARPKVPLGPVPDLTHPPLPSFVTPGPTSPMLIGISPVDETDYQGTARIFMAIAEKSKATYAIESGNFLPANVADAYMGPVLVFPDQRRPYSVISLDEEGRTVVLDRVPNESTASIMVEAELAVRHEAWPEALERYKAAARKQPALAKAWVRRAEMELRLGDVEAAGTSVAEAIRISSIDPFAHALHASVAIRQDDLERARRALVSALALYPGYPPALELMAHAVGVSSSWEPFRPPVRLIETDDGTILVQADARRTGAWLAWAMCEATTRYEPDRSLIPFEDDSFGVSLRRELSCVLALVDAATTAPLDGEPPEADPVIDRIADIAVAGFLSEFTIHDIIAPRFPAVLIHLSPAQRLRLGIYIDRFVLPPRAGKTQLGTVMQRGRAATKMTPPETVPATRR